MRCQHGRRPTAAKQRSSTRQPSGRRVGSADRCLPGACSVSAARRHPTFLCLRCGGLGGARACMRQLTSRLGGARQGPTRVTKARGGGGGGVPHGSAAPLRVDPVPSNGLGPTRDPALCMRCMQRPTSRARRRRCQAVFQCRPPRGAPTPDHTYRGAAGPPPPVSGACAAPSDG